MRQAYLAKEVLAEIPDQVTGYMKKHGIKPSSKVNAPHVSIAASQWFPPPLILIMAEQSVYIFNVIALF